MQLDEQLLEIPGPLLAGLQLRRVPGWYVGSGVVPGRGDLWHVCAFAAAEMVVNLVRTQAERGLHAQVGTLAWRLLPRGQHA